MKWVGMGLNLEFLIWVDAPWSRDLKNAGFGQYRGNQGGAGLGEPGGAADLTQHIKKKSKNPISRA